jgi:tetratricopeptide (TPR) repeat protein
MIGRLTSSWTAVAVALALASPTLAQNPGAAPSGAGTPQPSRPAAGSVPAAGQPPAAAPSGAPRPAAGTPPAAQPSRPAAAPGAAAATQAPGTEATQPPPKVDPKIFDEALRDYFDGKPEPAARKLYSFIESTPPTDENYAWAQYFLGRCLIDLNLRHAGAVYLAKVAHERSNPQVLPKTLEGLRVLTQVPHDEVLIDEQIFGSLDLGFLPDSVSDYANYQQGLVDLRVGNERWANTHFVKLEEGGVEASRAQFALLVTRLRNAKGVVDDKIIDDFLELSKDEKLTQEARNEARLAVARLRYEKKDYEGALKAYDMVQLPSLDPGRATLYLEEAWTRYNLGQLRATIGLLTTLDAPSFRDEFLPDKYILRALVYRDLCQYLPAKRAAKELTRRFGDSLEAIRERDNLTQDPRLRRAASSHGATKRASRFLESLNVEGELLSRHAGGFGDRLYKHLTRVYDLAHAEGQRIYDQRLKEAVREEADKLLRASEQVRLMEYEVGLKLYERIKKGSKLVLPEKETPVTTAQLAFRFDGEYWNDELRSYRVSIPSRCLEEGAQ